MNKIIARFFVLFIIATSITIAGCNNDDGNDCTASGEASWKINGVAEECYLSSHITTSTLLSLSFQSCEHNVLTMAYIPFPPAAGTYQLKYGPGVTSTQTGAYATNDNKDYGTNETVNGTLIITEVDLSGKTLSGTFSFDAVKTGSPGEIIHITEGQITDTNYEY